MYNMKRWILTIAIAAPTLMCAQDINLVQFESLKSKATDTVEVNLTEAMLGMAGGFLSDSDPKQADVKKILGGIKGIFVRSLKFDKEGQYSTSDMDAIRTQLKGAGWQSMVDVHSTKSGGDNAGVYMRSDGKKMTGLVVLAFEPKELTVVNISGTIDPSQIQALSGTLGIPNFNVGFDKGKGGDKKDDKKKEE
jgi:hypothetical protein